MFSYLKALSTLNTSEFNKLWKDDIKRANLFLFLHDMLLMLLLGLLVKALFSWDDIKEEPWIKRWTASALYGSFQDGPVQNIIVGMIGDLNPPAYSIFKNMFNNVGDIITGDKNLWEGVTSNFGALRELGTATSLF